MRGSGRCRLTEATQLHRRTEHRLEPVWFDRNNCPIFFTLSDGMEMPVVLWGHPQGWTQVEMLVEKLWAAGSHHTMFHRPGSAAPGCSHLPWQDLLRCPMVLLCPLELLIILLLLQVGVGWDVGRGLAAQGAQQEDGARIFLGC